MPNRRHVASRFTGGLEVDAGGLVVKAGGLTVTSGAATVATGGLNVQVQRWPFFSVLCMLAHLWVA